MAGSVVVVGGTTGIGKEIARHYAGRDFEVVVSGRDRSRADEVAAEIGGKTSGIAVDLTKPNDIAGALDDLGPVRHLIVTAVDRDENSVREYNIAGALSLVTLKLVGYTEVVHALLDRFDEDSSIVMFGGLAKDRPYPGSTTVTTVNGGVTSMINTLAVELAPIRVNAIHPSVVGDSPYWLAKPPEVLDNLRSRTPLGRLVTTSDIVGAVAFLAENPAVTGVNLRIDAGWMLT